MCGLFGIINAEPKKLNKPALLTLGVNNDSRGGDSCGVFIDGQVEYGYDKLKLFANFWPTSKLIANTTSCRIALGHCRKASVGGVGQKDEKAQPVVLRNEQGDIEFVLTHNGTIRNHDELAKKYIPDIDVKNMTDSQIMARIFHRCGYDVLGEYIGAGVFIIGDFRGETPEILFFKGKSKPYQYSQNLEEERPLYFVEVNGSIIYSSISAYLYTLFPGKEVYTLNPNLLIRFDNGTLKVVKEYDRKDLWQGTYTSASRGAVVSYNRLNDYDEDDCYDSYYSRRSYQQTGSGFGGNAQGSGFQEPQKKETQEKKTLIIPPPPVKTQVHTLTTPSPNLNSYIIGSDNTLKYTCGGKPVTGIYKVTEGGLILSPEESASKCQIISFFEGVPLYNSDCLDFLLEISENWECTPSQLLEIYPDLIYYLSPFPFRDNRFTKSCLVYKMTSLETKQPHTGRVGLLFEDWFYPCSKGIVSMAKYIDRENSTMKEYDRLRSFSIPQEVKDSLVVTTDENN